jgi:hypothetical protein
MSFRKSSLAVVLISIASGCAHPARPTMTGAELYAQIRPLQETGQATVGQVTIRKDQVLTTGAAGQTFLVEQVIEKCHGGDPGSDVDCTLALLLDQRFTVTDHVPEGRTIKADHEDQSRSIVTSVVVVGLGVAAVSGLVYGVATCEFPGCQAVFGVPLVLIGGAALFMLGRD